MILVLVPSDFISNEGGEKIVECDNMEEFMNVLELVRAVVDEDVVAYSEVKVKT